MDSVNIGQEIIILRGAKGWTQQQLADMLQTTVRTIGAWESGASIPRNAMKVKIAKVLNFRKIIFFRMMERRSLRRPFSKEKQKLRMS